VFNFIRITSRSNLQQEDKKKDIVGFTRNLQSCSHSQISSQVEVIYNHKAS
jgi:hypothetical protein